MRFSIPIMLFFLVSAHFVLAQSPDSIASMDKTSPETIVFTKVDKPASFPGGSDGWRDYLIKNLKYPKKAVKAQIQGIVRVQFLVDREGNISEALALNDPGGGLADAAVKIISGGPKWIPAEQNGRKVIYRHIQAITFKLQ